MIKGMCTFRCCDLYVHVLLTSSTLLFCCLLLVRHWRLLEDQINWGVEGPALILISNLHHPSFHLQQKVEERRTKYVGFSTRFLWKSIKLGFKVYLFSSRGASLFVIASKTPTVPPFWLSEEYGSKKWPVRKRSKMIQYGEGKAARFPFLVYFYRCTFKCVIEFFIVHFCVCLNRSDIKFYRSCYGRCKIIASKLREF